MVDPNASTPLMSGINAETATAAASSGLSFLNAAGSKILKARDEGPLTFRMLGLIGGLAMMVSNGFSVLSRFFSFNFTGALIALYCVCFGALIVVLEGPMILPAVPYKDRIQSGIRVYAKFLDFTWGRGALYFFVGSLQVSNVNMLDWVVGGFMIFVGVTAVGVGIATAQDMRLLKASMADEAKLKEKFAAHDTDGSGKLDVKELTAFVQDAGVHMNRNEIAATFLALGTIIVTRAPVLFL